MSDSQSPEVPGDPMEYAKDMRRPIGSVHIPHEEKGGPFSEAISSKRLNQLSDQGPESESRTRHDAIHHGGLITGRDDTLRTSNYPSPIANSIAETPSEAALLRDLPFTLQGLSSTNLPFTSPTTLQLPPNLPLPIVSILSTLAEPSLLYRSLTEFIQSRDEGLVGQSFRSAVGNELRSYLGLIATLEGEIRRALVSSKGVESHASIGKTGVTLKRCVVWTRDATMGLRLMSLMAEESKSDNLLDIFHGGMLTIYSQKRRPVDFVNTFLFYLIWGSICRCICRTYAGANDATVL